MIDIFYLDGGVKKAGLDSIKELKGRKIWIDATDMKKEEADSLKEHLGLHPLTAEDLFNSNVRIKVEEFPDYLFCVFYALKKGKRMSLMEMDFIIGKDFLLTNHKAEIKSFKELKSDDSRVERNMKKGLDMLFHRLLDLEIDNYFPTLEELDDRIEALEEEATQKPSPAVGHACLPPACR